eukprot:Clim_evm49s134 gene=Clim_evmTU49s134
MPAVELETETVGQLPLSQRGIKYFVRHAEELLGRIDHETGHGAGTDNLEIEWDLLNQEGQQVRNLEMYGTSEARLDCNRWKNRAQGILPFDHNRVVLSPVAGQEGSDYINASLVQDPDGHVAYIASQGPLYSTADDFWRMIWSYDVGLIVCLTELQENGVRKCAQYWPDLKESKKFGGLKVTCKKEARRKDYTAWRLQLRLGAKLRSVCLLMYTQWPDNGMPYSVPSFMNLLETVRRVMSEDMEKTPVVIHDSLGIGQTGVMCAINIIVSELEQHGSSAEIDVYKTVRELRESRMQMVQTKEQYGFIYEVVLRLLQANFAALVEEAEFGFKKAHHVPTTGDGYDTMRSKLVPQPMRPPPPEIQPEADIQAHQETMERTGSWVEEHFASERVEPRLPKRGTYRARPSGSEAFRKSLRRTHSETKQKDLEQLQARRLSAPARPPPPKNVPLDLGLKMSQRPSMKVIVPAKSHKSVTFTSGAQKGDDDAAKEALLAGKSIGSYKVSEMRSQTQNLTADPKFTSVTSMPPTETSLEHCAPPPSAPLYRGLSLLSTNSIEVPGYVGSETKGTALPTAQPLDQKKNGGGWIKRVFGAGKRRSSVQPASSGSRRNSIIGGSLQMQMAPAILEEMPPPPKPLSRDHSTASLMRGPRKMPFAPHVSKTDQLANELAQQQHGDQHVVDDYDDDDEDGEVDHEQYLMNQLGRGAPDSD